MEDKGISPPANLRYVDEDSLKNMFPGDILRLADMESLRESIDSVFCAVLACPRCGVPGLITLPQYLGAFPVICGSKLCSCQFRIEAQHRLVYLPAD